MIQSRRQIGRFAIGEVLRHRIMQFQNVSEPGRFLGGEKVVDTTINQGQGCIQGFDAEDQVAEFIQRK